MFSDEHSSILDQVIYGDLDESSYNTLIQHDTDITRKDKFFFNRVDLQYHFDMCHATEWFQTRYHMLEPSYFRIVDILRDDVIDNNKLISR